ncbi:Zinc finger MYM-type protein 1 [Araneus ventricosus]|uniref:Zinc finger MYM-type protein 1 n=1 Tax=Araneus ventricosus TaxID=182803 RepID=A0A4Y2THW2_ARAVE|nr:Zinc finger MYM-type protein 1 [Araneus ventricosus]
MRLKNKVLEGLNEDDQTFLVGKGMRQEDIIELPVRGSSDFGDLQNGGFEPVVNDGNFRALLRMRISCGDTNLKEHVENTPLNPKYFSPEIRNNIIKICGNTIEADLVKKINDAKCFAVLVDSTTDISVTEQVSSCVRYVTQGDRSFSLQEDFLEFFSIKTATGRNLGNHILDALSSLGVNCSNLCGQGYDGASSMSGCFNGVQAVINETNPAALYVHCSSHSLNLALMHA